MSNDSQKRVLIVDDEQILRDAISTYLELRGFDVSLADNRQDAINFANSKTFDALVIDYGLCDTVNGSQVAREIHELQPNIVVFIISGYPLERVNLLEFDESNFFTKPFHPEKLATAISSALIDQAN